MGEYPGASVLFGALLYGVLWKEELVTGDGSEDGSLFWMTG